ncbi:hypothetical protein BJY00DRAFT_318134 [Aspergillus carlsbadensis]|nr:hypothetical protein BJY00DRAFT_318134 [Aspergillus carlsbadensis]
MLIAPLFPIFAITPGIAPDYINILLNQAYGSLPPAQYSLYVMQTMDMPPLNTPAALNVTAFNSPFTEYEAQDIAAYLFRLCNDQCGLSLLQFLAIDRHTKIDGTILFGRTELGDVGGNALQFARLRPDEVNLIPIAVDLGTIGLDEVILQAGQL